MNTIYSAHLEDYNGLYPQVSTSPHQFQQGVIDHSQVTVIPLKC